MPTSNMFHTLPSQSIHYFSFITFLHKEIGQGVLGIINARGMRLRLDYVVRMEATGHNPRFICYHRHVTHVVPFTCSFDETRNEQ